jgi:hypothetical protein
LRRLAVIVHSLTHVSFISTATLLRGAVANVA